MKARREIVVDPRLIRAARDVVRLMDRPLFGDAKEAAAAWRAGTRLANALRQHREKERRNARA